MVTKFQSLGVLRSGFGYPFTYPVDNVYPFTGTVTSFFLFKLHAFVLSRPLCIAILSIHHVRFHNINMFIYYLFNWRCNWTRPWKWDSCCNNNEVARAYLPLWAPSPLPRQLCPTWRPWTRHLCAPDECDTGTSMYCSPTTATLRSTASLADGMRHGARLLLLLAIPAPPGAPPPPLRQDGCLLWIKWFNFVGCSYRMIRPLSMP
jgi:hypothetical protein